MTSSPPAYAVAIFVHSVCRNSSCASTAGNSSSSNFFARSTTPTASTACGPAQSTGSPIVRPSIPRQVPGACTADWSCSTALPAIGYSAPDRDALCSPQRSSRSPWPTCGRRLSAPIRNRPSGSNRPPRYCARPARSARGRAGATGRRRAAPSGRPGAPCRPARTGGPACSRRRGCRTRPPASSSGRCPGWPGGAATRGPRLPGRRRQGGERPEHRNLRAGDRVEQGDDQHGQRTGQHAGGSRRGAANCTGAGRCRVPRGGPSMRGAETGDPADRRWGAEWSMSIVIMPLPTAIARNPSAWRVDR